jgi:hypothetical protein
MRNGCAARDVTYNNIYVDALIGARHGCLMTSGYDTKCCVRVSTQHACPDQNALFVLTSVNSCALPYITHHTKSPVDSRKCAATATLTIVGLDVAYRSEIYTLKKVEERNK